MGLIDEADDWVKDKVGVDVVPGGSEADDPPQYQGKQRRDRKAGKVRNTGGEPNFGGTGGAEPSGAPSGDPTGVPSGGGNPYGSDDRRQFGALGEPGAPVPVKGTDGIKVKTVPVSGGGLSKTQSLLALVKKAFQFGDAVKMIREVMDGVARQVPSGDMAKRTNPEAEAATMLAISEASDEWMRAAIQYRAGWESNLLNLTGKSEDFYHAFQLLDAAERHGFFDNIDYEFVQELT